LSQIKPQAPVLFGEGVEGPLPILSVSGRPDFILTMAKYP